MVFVVLVVGSTVAPPVALDDVAPAPVDPGTRMPPDEQAPARSTIVTARALRRTMPPGVSERE
jgi:hypothetical protein